MRRAAREVKRRSAGTARLGGDWEEEAVEGGRAELADEEQAVAAGAGAAAAAGAGAISPRGGASLPSSLRKPLHLLGESVGLPTCFFSAGFITSSRVVKKGIIV